MRTAKKPTTRVTDQHGVEHASKCDVPELKITVTTLPGWNLARCPSCGSQRLTRRAANA